LHPDEIEDLAQTFRNWFRRVDSRIVCTAALQGMADLAFRDVRLIAEALQMTEQALSSPIPALKARARKLKGPLERLQGAGQD